MKKIKFEEMFPDELIKFQKEGKPVYLPVGSMEWHSVHLGMGVDTIHAENVALEVAKKLGGAVFPALYIGTESMRSPESLRRLGFQGNEKIKGMDFPKNSLRSCYWPPELFRNIITMQVEQLLIMGFQRIVILNGHGAANQKDIIQNICEEYSQGDVRLLSIMVLFQDCGVGLGHAGLAETALMEYLCPEAADTGRLPAKAEKLFYRDYGIADAGGHDSEHFVHYDPRDATAELGQKMFQFEVKRCEEIIQKTFHL
ncbi:MAG: creatininase family protein [Blautia sp.]|nr:creatininase family protein [Blautia sp.]